jgi:hypothetical protein
MRLDLSIIARLCNALCLLAASSVQGVKQEDSRLLFNVSLLNAVAEIFFFKVWPYLRKKSFRRRKLF